MTRVPPGRIGRALLELCVRAYPRSFRSRFGPDLRAAAEDRLREASSRPPWPRFAATARLAADLGVSGLKERLRPAFHDTDSNAHRPGAISMTDLLQDLRFALRSLRRRPAFTLVALLTLSVGIGASTAVFTVVNGVLLRPLPFSEPGELFTVWSFDTEGERSRGWMSQPDVTSVRELSAIERVEGVSTTGLTYTGGQRPERVATAQSTGSLMAAFGIAPSMGRDIRGEDNRSSASRVVVVSHDFWQTRLGGDPDILGSTIRLEELSWEIVGVAPEGYSYPEGTHLWRAYGQDDDDEGCGRGCHIYPGAVVRLAQGVSVEVAQAELQGLAGRLEEAYPGSNTDKGMWLEPLVDTQVGDVRLGLWVVFGAVGLVLLIVCANMANLLLVRASGRGREVAVRTAMGAGRGRLFAQVVTESAVLAAVGGVLGLALSSAFLSGLRSLAVDRLPRMAEVAVDGGVLAFVAAVTAAVALLFGASPALHLVGRGGAARLLGGARGRADVAGARVRSGLIAAEVAFSVLLLAGSGLLLQSLERLYAVDVGFDGANVTRFTIALPSARYGELDDLVRFYRELEAGLSALPGVETVGSGYGSPLSWGNSAGTVLVEGRPEAEPGASTVASVRPVTPGYFDAMGIDVLRGRGIERSDEQESEPVAVVNETFVAENFPAAEVLGARVRVTVDFGNGSPYRRVVGVVRDVRRSMSGEPVAAVYPPHAQFGPRFMTVHLRARPGAPDLVSGIRSEVGAMDPNLVVRDIETVAEAKRRDTASTRLFLTLVGIFAAIAVLLAAVGLYGVVAFLVAQRTREIGIRMALGARRANVTGMVLRQGLRPTLAGIVVGIAVALLGGSVIEGLLFGVDPADPVVLTGVVLLVGGVACAATLLPARRATRVEPTVALSLE